MAFKPQDRLLLEDGRVYPVDALLLRGSCPDCSEPLEWAANVEGDDTDYTAECCEFVLRARPYALKVSVIERGGTIDLERDRGVPRLLGQRQRRRKARDSHTPP